MEMIAVNIINTFKGGMPASVTLEKKRPRDIGKAVETHLGVVMGVSTYVTTAPCCPLKLNRSKR